MLLSTYLNWASVLLTIAGAESDIDPWDEVSSFLQGKLRKLDVTNPNAYDMNDNEQDATFYVSMDYHEEEERSEYESVWQYYNENSDQDWHKSVYDKLLVSADQFNNTEAMYKLSQINLWGQYGYPHNKSIAFQYLQKFNDMTSYENSSALFDLAVAYSTGLFGTLPVDVARGLLYFQRSARLGDLKAKQVLAYRYFSGYSVARDVDKALLLYKEIAEEIKKKYSEEQWNMVFPYIESYIVRIPDFDEGLLGKGLSTVPLSVRRKKTTRPPFAGSSNLKPIGDVGYGEVVMQFKFNAGNGNPGSFVISDSEHEDRLVELFYTAWDLYKGTYTRGRDCDKAKRLLLQVYKTYDAEVKYMDNLQKFFYVKSLDLLAHMYFTGEGFERPNVQAALDLFDRSEKILEGAEISRTASEVDKGLISQYYFNNTLGALKHYKKAKESGNAHGILFYQLGKLSEKNPELKIGDPYLYMQEASSQQYLPAQYEFAKMVESNELRKYSVEDITRLYKAFVEENENIMAPHLRLGFSELLGGSSEVSLYAYAQAAEQGYEAAQISAAYLLYQLPYKFDDPPETTIERKTMAISYYTRAFKQGNTDAAVVAGDIYFQMKNYTKALSLYQSAALKFSAQALWNIGYMYEHGLGVEKDFHLAKRFYDQILEHNQKLYFAVKASVMKLQLKSWFMWLNGKELDNISIDQEQESTVVRPFFDRLVQLLKNLSRETRGDNKKKNQHRILKEKKTPSQGIMERFGLQTEDLLTMVCVLIIFAISMFFRTVAPRGQWNVRINGVNIAGGNALGEEGNPENENEEDDENDDEGRARARNNFGFGNNFDVQVFAI